jgi:hypothetical protein
MELGLLQLKEDGTPDPAFAATTPDSDLYPDAFTIPGATAPYGTIDVTSGLVTLNGFNAPTPIYITGGKFAIDCQGTFAISGAISPGQSICLRADAPTTASSSVQVRAVVGSRVAYFTITSTAEAVDTAPDAFSFTNQTNVAVSTAVTSNAVTITGIAGLASVAVEQGEYSIGCSAQGFTSNRGTVTNGQTVCVRHTSSAQNSTAVTTTLAVGGVTATFSSTTLAAQNSGGSNGGGTTTPPPPTSTGNNGGSGGGSSGGGGGGGAMDGLTVLGLLGLVALSATRRRRALPAR